MERARGFEPLTASLEGWNSTTELRPHLKTGSGQGLRLRLRGRARSTASALPQPEPSRWWAGKDSNLGSRWQQIYSLPPLSTWVPALTSQTLSIHSCRRKNKPSRSQFSSSQWSSRRLLFRMDSQLFWKQAILRMMLRYVKWGWHVFLVVGRYFDALFA